MDEIEVVEIVIVASLRKEAWIGEAYYYAPPAPALWNDLVAIIMAEAMPGALSVLSKGKRWKFQINGQLHKLTGPPALKMRNYLNRVGGNLTPRFTWTPDTQLAYTIPGVN